jgi:hypothetical protein
MPSTIALVGDSIFDNAAYVPGEPCVTEQLQALVGDSAKVRLLAVDGDCVPDVAGQIKHLPWGTSHILVSAGGNDALMQAHKLDNDYGSSRELFTEWTAIQRAFRDDYRRMLEAVLTREVPTVVCTVYDAVPDLDAIAVTALSLFNDVIVDEAVKASLPIVDLRSVCTDREDYSVVSPIEPSCQGGARIAAALQRVLTRHDFNSNLSAIYR